MIEYQDVIVRKPWGYEYLMYQNGIVGVWFLHINQGSRTSLHCHPIKKTGLILLSGEAVISFLNDSKFLRSLSKVGIRQGVFHSTAAISPEGISVIEIETPCVKENLVRLDDTYGRDEIAYEGGDAIIPMDNTCIKLDDPEEGKQLEYSLAGCRLSVHKFKDNTGLADRNPNEIIAVLKGGLVSQSGELIVCPGDVLSPDTLDRLAQKFSTAPEGAEVLIIRKESR